ncbi:MAG TPA: LysM peptidoglycan-binding domain-containing protein [Candidatus Competibacteraceae bacterium]|nr:LysM peptidoglycan-binding domain-containing protein [Candidatus Competibacteraceae bacterium]
MTTTKRLRPRHRTVLLLTAIAVLSSGCTQARMETGKPGSNAAATPQNPPPLVAASQPAVPPKLKAGHPQRYTVVPGDTLWGIAERYLKDPWRWKEIWRQNPNIRNPDLIYPGDVLELYYEDGAPRLRVAERRPGERPTVKLSPQVRVEQATRPIPTVPREAVAAYLERSKVMSKAEWEKAPYLLSGLDEHISYVTGERTYARGAMFDHPIYQIYRPGNEYRDPVSQKPLGYNMVYIGEARVEEDGDPASLTLTAVERNALPGDRLFPVEGEEETLYQYQLRPAPVDTEGQILEVLNGEFLIGRYHTVVVNLGEADGVEPGHVLKVLNQGDYAKDPFSGQQVRLPDERAGLLMIYKVFDSVSYGLIMEANRPIRPYDRVVDPSA